MTQISRNYTEALYGFDAVIQRVPADRWDEASPCDGWCARDVVAHAAGVVDAVAQMTRTGENALPETPDPGDDPVGLWNSSRDSLLEALDEPGALGKVGNYWFGESTIEDILAFSQWDPLIHAWDLGQAVGLEAHTNQDLAESSLEIIGANAETLRAMSLMGPEVQVPADADPMTRLLGLTGRNPLQ
ncbi:MAG: maleylpyruvate isomerase family mycothiol-dependent enzyme [Acidimicrobiia bacterium]|nr:maleylpyruvate isomerase family mycothiol-dependent enzyme [Acidimicrobiia bacterium]